MKTPSLKIQAVRREAIDEVHAQVNTDRRARQSGNSPLRVKKETVANLLPAALHREVVLPEKLRDAKAKGTRWLRDEATLWDAAEHQASDKNPVMGRRVMLQIPRQLQKLALGELKKLGTSFSEWTADNLNVGVDYSIRRDKKSALYFDIMVTSREVSTSGFMGKSKLEPTKKTVEAGRVAKGYASSMGEVWGHLTQEAINAKQSIKRRAVNAYQGAKLKSAAAKESTATVPRVADAGRGRG